MKHILFAIIFSVCLKNSFSQTLQVKTQTSQSLIKILNDLEMILDTSSQELHLRIFLVDNGTGSYQNGDGEEVTHMAYFAVSEYDEAPQQNVFSVGPMYDPKLVQVAVADPYKIYTTFEFGPENKRTRKTFKVALKEISIIQ